jgi:hypothetical protein
MVAAPPDRRQPSILLVGAFERDNFGDSLFLALSRRLFPVGSTAAASVLSADMSAVSGVRVLSVDEALRSCSWDVVWVVGGEVGGVTVRDALPMSLAGPAGDAYEGLDDHDRAAFDRIATGLESGAAAYIPDLGLYPAAVGTDLVLHSVGVGAAARESGGAEASSLRSARVLTVRERASVALLDELGVTSVLAPDLVHSLPLFFPELRPSVDESGRPRFFVFQMNDGMFQASDVDDIAETVLAVGRDQGLRTVLLPAGTARHHDDPASYERLASAMRALDPGADVEVVDTRDPLGIAMVIASAACWVGSSLHGRIVASAYHVPRVSLAVQKVTAYAETWSDGMPYDVPLEGIRESVGVAIARGVVDEQRATDDDLTRLSYDSALAAVREVLGA